MAQVNQHLNQANGKQNDLTLKLGVTILDVVTWKPDVQSNITDSPDVEDNNSDLDFRSFS